MIVYFLIMRLKDNSKQKAISTAAITLIHEIGFASASMSRIARAAGVSPSTIYVYFQNKEDMINKLYIWGKKELFNAVYRGVDFREDITAGFRMAFHNFFNFMRDEPVLFSFCEQFANSPYLNNISRGTVEQEYGPALTAIEEGIAGGLFLKSDPHIILNQLFSPVLTFVKNNRHDKKSISKKTMEEIYRLSWRAVCK